MLVVTLKIPENARGPEAHQKIPEGGSKTFQDYGSGVLAKMSLSMSFLGRLLK